MKTTFGTMAVTFVGMMISGAAPHHGRNDARRLLSPKEGRINRRQKTG